jgi:dihydrofolate reductase
MSKVCLKIGSGGETGPVNDMLVRTTKRIGANVMGKRIYFVTEGPARALELARKSAGDRDVRIAGGADVIQQYLSLGVVEELRIESKERKNHGCKRY